MAFWDVIRRWFSGPARDADVDADEEGGVAVLDAPEPAGEPEFSARDFEGETFVRARLAVVREADPMDPQPAPGWWTPEGTPVVTPPAPNLRLSTVDSNLHAYLLKVLEDPNVELPRLPQVANHALTMLAGEKCDFRKLAEAIGRDPALSADVLRVANSVAYRGIKEIMQLEQAFVRMGVRGVRSLLLAANVRGLAIRSGGEKNLAQEVWRRSVASGVILAAFARRFHVPEDDAFLVGLLHDIGDLALLRIIHDHQKTAGQKVPRGVFDAISARWHEHLGLRLADVWNLPDPLPQIIGQHHGEYGEHHPERTYRLLVGVADAACALLRYGPYVPYDFFKLPAVQELGLRCDADTRAVLEELPAKIEERLAAF